MGGKESLVLHVFRVCCLVFHSFELLGENEILSQRIGTCWNTDLLDPSPTSPLVLQGTILVDMTRKNSFDGWDETASGLIIRLW